MDPISAAYYASVCGLLGLVSPYLGRLVVRLIVGACVGVAAAGALPFVQGLIATAPYAS